MAAASLHIFILVSFTKRNSIMHNYILYYDPALLWHNFAMAQLCYDRTLLWHNFKNKTLQLKSATDVLLLYIMRYLLNYKLIIILNY